MAMFSNGTGSPFPTGANPVSNATADLDGDGDLDLLTTNYISDSVSVLLNNGAGVFAAGAPVIVGNGPREVEAGDLDGDGDIDFIASNYSGNSVSVRLNNGNGTFAGVTNVPVGTVPRGLALGDLDGDGDLDFVSANYQSNNVSVMLNNGSGGFAAAAGSPFATGTRPVAVVLADFDGEGDRDMAVTSNNTNTVSILLNNGAGGFTALAPVATGTGPRGIAAGDFDGDGDNDLVVTNFSANSLSILVNNGAGVFAAVGAPLVTQNNPYAVTVGDLDGDGHLDIASTNSASSSVSVFLNNGSGGFAPASGSPFSVGVSPGGIVIGDFDGDGFRDLSTANFGSNTASILINTPHPPTNVTFSNVRPPIPENSSTRTGTKVADIVVTDDGGLNRLTLGGADAALFQIVGTELRLRRGVNLDYDTNPLLSVQVRVDGVGVGNSVDVSRTLALRVVEVMTGTFGPDVIGALGNNGEIIHGGSGDDIIGGGRGADRIFGWRGDDTMTGGLGSDDFVFKSILDSAPRVTGLGTDGRFSAAVGEGRRDIITDFQHGFDDLDFSAIDANADMAGNQEFRFGGNGNFTATPGKLIVRKFNPAGTDDDKTIVYGDIDGDGRADFQVELTGRKTLTEGDFVL